MERLKAGLSKTSSNLSLLFVGARIDEGLYEELEAALLMSDAGMEATQFLLDGLRRRVKEDKLLDAAAVKNALRELMTEVTSGEVLVKSRFMQVSGHEMLVGVGNDRPIHFFELAGETVWGATARILVGFLAHLTAFVAARAASAPPERGVPGAPGVS